MAQWTIADRREVFRARKWSVERSLRVREDDPTCVGHEFFLICIADFVNIVPVTAAQEIVFVRQFRHGIERPTLELPGGLLDAGETDPMAAAIREMQEETGYALPPGATAAALGVILPNPALLNNSNHFFVAEEAAPTSVQALETTEDAEIVLVPAARIGAMIDSGEIDNAMMIAGLTLFERWRAKR